MIGESLSAKMRLMRELFSGGHFGVTAEGCGLCAIWSVLCCSCLCV